MNNDFQGLNHDYPWVNDAFDSIKSKTNITFCLAQLDPKGNPTNGMIYHPKTTGFATASKNAEIQSVAWDNRRYLNVYVMEDLYGNGGVFNSGIATYPDEELTAQNLSRIVYNGQYLNSNTDGEFSSVLTHEFGHFLNLIHIWGDQTDSGDSLNCFIDDEVDDTPNTIGGEGCEDYLVSKCGGIKFNGENYMDYNTRCYKMFTKGQVDRMYTALQHSSRNTLWKEINLMHTGILEKTVDPSVAVIQSAAKLQENTINDGSFNDTLIVKLGNGSFDGTPRILQNGTDYTLTGTPDGLTVEIRFVTESILEINFIGNATSHDVINNTDQLMLTLMDPLFTSISAQDVIYHSFPIELSFYGSFKAKCGLLDVPSSIDSKSRNFSVNFGAGNYAIHYLENFGPKDIKIESFQKGIVAYENTKRIVLLNEGDLISPESNFEYPEGSFFPHQYDLELSNPNYVDWQGKTGFAGLEIKSGDVTHYGWLKISVSENGSEAKIIGYGISEAPNGSIRAGHCSIETTDIEADFFSFDRRICIGDSVEFFNTTTGNPESYSWEILNATPSNSNERSPTVQFDTEGTYDVTLTITKDGVTSTILKEDYIIVGNSFPIPFQEGFEQGIPSSWKIYNPDGRFQFEINEDGFGKNSNNALVMNNADNDHIGEIDEIILPPFNTSSATMDYVTLSFSHAYTKFDENSPDELEVFYSSDCGVTWNSVFKKNHLELETKEVSTAESNFWKPSPEDYVTNSIQLPEDAKSDQLMIKFRNTSGFGTWLWIDAINLDAPPLSVESRDLNLNLSIFPNPSNGEFKLTSNLDQKGTITIYNTIGKRVLQQEIMIKKQQVLPIHFSGAKGTYIIQFISTQGSWHTKLFKNR